MNIEEIKKLIQQKYPDKYPDERFQLLAGKIEAMAPDIRKALEKFLQTGEIEPIELSGYTLDKLIKEHSMNEIASYLTLDWIARDPAAALGSLKKGHDSVT